MRGRIQSTAAAFAGLAIAPLAVGGVHLPVVLSLLIIFSLALVWRLKKKDRGLRIPIFSIGAFFVATLCLIQIVPLPPFLFGALSPVSDRAFEGASLLNAPDAWFAISVDISETADRGLRFLTLSLACLLIANINKRGWWKTLIFAISITAGLVFTVGLILMLTETTSLIFYESPVGFRRPSTFVNTNHGAAYFGFTFLVGLAWFDRIRKTDLDKRSSRQIYIAGLVVVASILLTVIHDSVGVYLALVFAVWVYALTIPRWFRPPIFAVPFIIVASLAFVWWLDVPKAVGWAQPLGDISNRALVTRAGLDAAAMFWPAGSGAGTMDIIMGSSIDWSQIAAYSIPTLENEVLEFFVAFGFVVGLAIFVALLAWIAVGVRRTHQKPSSLRARWHVTFIAYLVGLAFFHFPFFTMGLAIPILFAIQTTDTSRYYETDRKFGFGLAFIAVAGLLLSIGNVQRIEPLQTEPLIDATTAAIKSGDRERVAELAGFLTTLDGRPKIQHYAARAFAKAGDPSKSAERYRRVFEISHVTKFRVSTFLKDIPILATRLEIAQSFDETQFEYVLRATRESEGPVRALDFAYLALDNNIHTTPTEAFVVDTFIQIDQSELALLWAETSGRSSDLAARIKLGSRAYEEAIEMMRNDPSRIPHPDVLRHAIPLLERGAQDLVDAATDEYCVSPIPDKRRLVCWSAEAAGIEIRGELVEAERMYEAITRRTGDPLPEAKFFVRHKRCKKVRGMMIREERQRFKTKLERILKTCGH